MVKFISKIDNNCLQKYKAMKLPIPVRIKNSVFKRQNEFAAGRLCAINALRILLGKFDGEIHQDHFFRPIWPNNVTGSISHSDNYAASAVSYKKTLLSIGIDIEEINSSFDKLEGMKNLIMTNSENDLLKDINEKYNLNQYISLFLIFSSKESLFKCINPLCDIMFDFKDAEVIDIDFKNQTFKMKVIKNLTPPFEKLRIFCGNFSFLFKNKVIYTQVCTQ